MEIDDVWSSVDWVVLVEKIDILVGSNPSEKYIGLADFFYHRVLETEESLQKEWKIWQINSQNPYKNHKTIFWEAVTVF